MKIKWSIPILSLALLVLTINCAKETMSRKYYVLENTSSKDRRIPHFVRTLPFRVEVRDFRVDKAFDQTRIADRSASNELDYYSYHYWAVRPPVAVADLVYRVLDKTQLFQRLTRVYSITSDYIVSGQIFSIERVDKANQTLVHIAGTMDLIDAKPDITVLRYEFDQTMPMTEDGSMNRFAALASELIYQESEAFSRKLADYFSVQELPAQ